MNKAKMITFGITIMCFISTLLEGGMSFVVKIIMLPIAIFISLLAIISIQNIIEKRNVFFKNTQTGKQKGDK